MTIQFIKVASFFVSSSMMDTILVVGFGVMDVFVSAVNGPFIFTSVALFGFGHTVRTGTLSPVLSSRFRCISGPLN